MTMGHKFTEDEADEYMKFIDPKNEGKFLYIDIVKKILKWLSLIFMHSIESINIKYNNPSHQSKPYNHLFCILYKTILMFLIYIK